ncbi:MAG: membrane protease subunit (stomatin/prohibitin family) [Cognaticolwellia sp.]|jgi:membrane protease subunit (stomatin/prohibitin family)
MSLWKTLKNHAGAQFLDVIQWLDDSGDTLVYRFPIFNQAIQDGGKLVVRPGQAAVFVNEGQLSESFGPGTFELSTRTKAISSFFDSIAYKLNYPYKGDVYFISTTRQTAQKWGTPAPFLFEDPKYGGIEIRAFGTFEYRITDPGRFLSEVVGTKGLFTSAEINGQLKAQLIDAFRANLKRLAVEKDINVNHLDTHFYELKGAFLEGMNPGFVEKYGLTLTDFSIGGLNLPDDLRAILNKRREMDMLGDPERFARFQAANAMRDAAQNPGMAGSMMGAGVGMGMGQMMGAQMSAPPVQHTPPPPPGPAQLHYTGPGGQAQLSAQEIAQRVAQDRTANHQVWAPGWPSWKSWDEVPQVASLLPPPAPPAPSASSYHYAGPAGQRGEYSAEEIQARIAGNPSGRHMVWKDGMPAWAEAKTVLEFQSAAPPPLPPPLPEP